MKGQCNGCGFETELKKFDVTTTMGKKTGEVKLCYLCRNTRNGNKEDIPSGLSNNDLGSIICFAANSILKKLDEIKNAE